MGPGLEIIPLAWLPSSDSYGLCESRRVRARGDVWFVANVAEEGLGDLRGMKAVVDRFGNDVHAYLVLEGLALGHVYHRAVGVKRYRVTARTAGGHSWSDYGHPSAIHELAKLIVGLTSLELASTSAYHDECGQDFGRNIRERDRLRGYLRFGFAFRGTGIVGKLDIGCGKTDSARQPAGSEDRSKSDRPTSRGGNIHKSPACNVGEGLSA